MEIILCVAKIVPKYEKKNNISTKLCIQYIDGIEWFIWNKVYIWEKQNDRG